MDAAGLMLGCWAWIEVDGVSEFLNWAPQR
jgi:hypothetical protein